VNKFAQNIFLPEIDKPIKLPYILRAYIICEKGIDILPLK